MVNVKCESLAEEVMSKLRDSVNHAEGLTFRSGIVLFRGREMTASVIH